MSRPTSLLQPGQVVGGCWEVGSSKLGFGTFSEIYHGTHISKKQQCALKVDRPSPRQDLLRWESNILQTMQKYPFVARHLGFLDVPENPALKCLAMSVLGPNVSAMRKRQPGNQLPFSAVMHMSLQMLTCVEAIHQEGYIHRDLKPSNFVLGMNKSGKKHLFVLDFGQSRQYIVPGSPIEAASADFAPQNIRAPREAVEFRGTSLYSSLNSHLLKDLGRRDDLWSIFYVLIDMCRGGLPWRPSDDKMKPANDRERCKVMKQWYMDHPSDLVAGLPGSEHLLAIQSHLMSLDFKDKPDYALVADCLKKTIVAAKAKGATKARPRPAYPESAELASLLESLKQPEVSAALASAAADAEEGELDEAALPPPASEGGGRMVVSTADMGVPMPLGSQPPFESPSASALIDGAATVGAGVGGISEAVATGVDGAAFPSSSPSVALQQPVQSPAAATSTAPLLDVDAQLVSDCDLTTTLMSTDSLLHSRGGRWSPKHIFVGVFGSISLEAALAVDTVTGNVSSEAKIVSSDIERYIKTCEQAIAGWEWEVPDDQQQHQNADGRDAAVDVENAAAGARSLSSSAASSSQPRFPSWLTGRRRIVAGIRLPSRAERSRKALLRDVGKLLDAVPMSLLWGAWSSVTSSTAASATPGSEGSADGSSHGAAVALSAQEYAIAWASIAAAVCNNGIIKSYKRSESVPASIQRLMTRLDELARGVASSTLLASAASSPASGGMLQQQCVQIAQEAAQLLHDAQTPFDFLPSRRSNMSGTSSGTSPLATVQRSLALVESWLAACGNKPTPFKPFASLALSGLSASAAPLSSAAATAADDDSDDDGGDAGMIDDEDDDDADDGREKRREARHDMSRLRSIADAINRERDLQRPQLTLDSLQSKRASTAGIPRASPPAIVSLSSAGGAAGPTSAIVAPLVSLSATGPVPASTTTAADVAAPTRKRSRWGDRDGGVAALSTVAHGSTGDADADRSGKLPRPAILDAAASAEAADADGDMEIE